MATYRANAPTSSSSEKPVLSPAQGGTPPLSSDTSPAVPSDVIYKLLGFTFAMAFFPLGSYFFTVNMVFNGESDSLALCEYAGSVRARVWQSLARRAGAALAKGMDEARIRSRHRLTFRQAIQHTQALSRP